MTFHTEVSHLKHILRKNALLIKLIGNCIKTFLAKKFLDTAVVLTVKEKEFFIVQSYIGNLSLALKTHLQNSFNKNLPYYCVPPLNEKKSKSKTTTAVKGHMLFCDYIVSQRDFKILTSSNSEFEIKIKGSLLISRDKPELNRNEKSLPLYLFH